MGLRTGKNWKDVGGMQGDLIGRILVYWTVVFFDQFLKIAELEQFWASISPSTSHVLILRKHGMGYILGDFFNKLIWSP
jgi:hypothetical protein